MLETVVLDAAHKVSSEVGYETEFDLEHRFVAGGSE